jgi:hypothetical protein
MMKIVLEIISQEATMREKQYTHAMTFFTSVNMYRTIKDVSDKKRVSLSAILRTAILKYLEAEGYPEKDE